MAVADEFRVARQSATSALQWAQRREEWLTSALAKTLALNGVPVTDIAKRLDLTVREARIRVGRPLTVYAVAKGQPVHLLAAVQTAVDEVVKHESGLDPEELWDWARIFDVNHGHASHTVWAPDDNVTQALADVRLYSRRLRQYLDDDTRAVVQRKKLLAECRARVFGADPDTIANLAAS